MGRLYGVSRTIRGCDGLNRGYDRLTTVTPVRYKRMQHQRSAKERSGWLTVSVGIKRKTEAYSPVGKSSHEHSPVGLACS
jgi:hypothetical protein